MSFEKSEKRLSASKGRMDSYPVHCEVQRLNDVWGKMTVGDFGFISTETEHE